MKKSREESWNEYITIHKMKYNGNRKLAKGNDGTKERKKIHTATKEEI